MILQEIVEDREPGVLQSMRSKRVSHDSATKQQECYDTEPTREKFCYQWKEELLQMTVFTQSDV